MFPSKSKWEVRSDVWFLKPYSGISAHKGYLNESESPLLTICRDNTKEKDKTEVAPEETEEREQATPRGRKTANSQGRRKGRITRSMTNEAAQANAAAAAATEEPPPPLPPPPEPCE